MTLQSTLASLFSLETVYVLTGLVLFVFAWFNLRDKTNRYARLTALFWFTLGFIFTMGSVLPHAITGLLVLLMVAIDGLGRVIGGREAAHGDEARDARGADELPPSAASPAAVLTARRDLGVRVFVPVLVIPLVTIACALLFKFFGSDVNRGALFGLGVGGIAAGFAARQLANSTFGELMQQGRLLNDRIGSISILPQLLASLGVIFAASKVGDLVARSILLVVPPGSLFLIAVANCLGMTLFTIVMGNSFAAFPVIATGVLVPLIIKPFGVDPAAVAIITLTAGSTGTLITPMAANFNVVPTALLNMRDEYGVIKFQLPFAVTIWIFHVALLWLAIKFLSGV